MRLAATAIDSGGTGSAPGQRFHPRRRDHRPSLAFPGLPTVMVARGVRSVAGNATARTEARALLPAPFSSSRDTIISHHPGVPTPATVAEDRRGYRGDLPLADHPGSPSLLSLSHDLLFRQGSNHPCHSERSEESLRLDTQTLPFVLPGFGPRTQHNTL